MFAFPIHGNDDTVGFKHPPTQPQQSSFFSYAEEFSASLPVGIILSRTSSITRSFENTVSWDKPSFKVGDIILSH